MTIDIQTQDVYAAVDGGEDEHGDVGFETRLAETIVNDELVPAAGNDLNRDRLQLVGALIAAAYVEDNGGGDVESISQQSASVSFDTDNALTLWRRAKQLDPTDRLGQMDKPAASLGVPDHFDIDYHGAHGWHHGGY